MLSGLAGCTRAVGPVPLSPSPADTRTSDVPPPDPSLTIAPLPSSTRSAGPSPLATRSSSSSWRATAFPEGTAVSCGTNPSADRVLAALRRVPGLLPAGAAVTVRTGPLCAGTWQYTVIDVTDREPLQAITQGPADDLQFVTAGTNVCTAGVRSTAPYAIFVLAGC